MADDDAPPTFSYEEFLERAQLQGGELRAMLTYAAALVRQFGGARSHHVEMSTLVSHKTREGIVQISLNGHIMQVNLTKARELQRMLSEAIEAAATDQMLVSFLMTKVGLSLEMAVAALSDFREMRHGSKGVVNPS